MSTRSLAGWLSALTMAVAPAVSCVGAVGPGGGDEPSGSTSGGGAAGMAAPPPAGAVVPASGLRRLTKSELGNTLRDLLAFDPTLLLEQIPDDRIDDPARNPFDNSYTAQEPSGLLVQSIQAVAEGAAETVLTKPALRDQVIGCAPSDPGCMKQFIARFAPRVLRRPLERQEVADLEALAAREDTFDLGAQAVITALLQDVEFLYRVERGTPTGQGDVARLDSWEMASRLSYLIWGSMPTDQVFALAGKNGLGTSDEIRRVAADMLTGAIGGAVGARRARERVDRFHAMWFRYEGQLSRRDPIANKLRAETNALLERVIFEQRQPWFELFRWKETFVDDALVAFYKDQLPKPGPAAKWIPYGQSGRRGILSHGSFLSAASAGSDTSTTLRGKHIRNQLLCETIPLPDPDALAKLNGGEPVDTSKPPEPASGECRLAVIQRNYLGRPGCAQCHGRMDTIGLGLEGYDVSGRRRTAEQGRPACSISGRGQFLMDDGTLTTFYGPSQLGDLLLREKPAAMGRCAVTQFLKFSGGRAVRPEEEAMVDALAAAFERSGYLFDELLGAYVSSSAFGFRSPE